MENIEKRNSVRSDNQVSKNVLFEGTANGKPRIMFVGNSITLHRPAPEIGWYGDWGMAASSKDRDYVHLLINHIKSKYPDAAFCIVQAAAWEREYRSCEIQKVCAGAESFDPDIIITRLSENIPADDIDSEPLISSMRNLHEYLSGDNKNVKHIVTSNVFNNKDKDAVLEDEIRANITGMKNELASALVYGLIADNPLGINGLFKHYDTYGSETADDTESAHYVFNALGVTGNTGNKSKLGSIVLVGWSPNTITAFHPEGHGTGGIEKSDKRVVDIADPDKGGDATYEAYLQYLYWKLGLAVRDYRYGGRICNIQRDLMLTKGYEGSYVELIDRLSQRVLDDDVKQAYYMDKQMWENVCVMFSRLTRGNAIKFEHIEGRKEKRLYGIPVRIMDPMKTNEAEVTAFSA